jgi:hypothetical protein
MVEQGYEAAPDGFADLAAGAPGEWVGSTQLAGAVSLLPGSAGD